MSMDPDQPSRKKVKHYDNGEPHFLTFSCYRRMPLLSKDRTRQWFVEALDEARAIHGFQLWGWVIMPEHVHVLLWPPFHSIASDPRSTRGRITGILSSIKRPVGEKAVSYLSEHSPDFLQAAGLSNFVRIMFGGIGTSVASTVWESRTTLHHAQLAEFSSRQNPAFLQATQGLMERGLSEQGAFAVLDRGISIQASTMAATDIFWISAILFLSLITLVWLTKPLRSSVPVDAGGAH